MLPVHILAVNEAVPLPELFTSPHEHARGCVNMHVVNPELHVAAVTLCCRSHPYCKVHRSGDATRAAPLLKVMGLIPCTREGHGIDPMHARAPPVSPTHSHAGRRPRCSMSSCMSPGSGGGPASCVQQSKPAFQAAYPLKAQPCRVFLVV